MKSPGSHLLLVLLRFLLLDFVGVATVIGRAAFPIRDGKGNGAAGGSGCSGGGPERAACLPPLSLALCMDVRVRVTAAIIASSITVDGVGIGGGGAIVAAVSEVFRGKVTVSQVHTDGRASDLGFSQQAEAKADPNELLGNVVTHPSERVELGRNETSKVESAQRC